MSRGAVDPAGDGFLLGAILDGRGGAQVVHGLDAVDLDRPGLWLHLAADRPDVAAFLHDREEFGNDATRALVAAETRPRTVPIDDGLLVILRGINLNEGAEPEDMISIRFWFDATRAVSTGRRRLRSLEDLTEALAQGRGPLSPTELVLYVADRMLTRMEPYLFELDERGDALEEQAFDGTSPARLHEDLADLRRQLIATRRYVAPQKEALTRLASELRLRDDALHATAAAELADRQTRMVEDLEELIARMAVVDDLVSSRASERLNRRLWVLSLVTAIFLPLGLVTGLLGINVGGIPLADSPRGFAAVCGLLLTLAAGQILVLRRRGWF